jgi:hypothetical protein
MRSIIGILLIALGLFMMVIGVIVYAGTYDVTFWLGVITTLAGFEVWPVQRL